jgi:hypothetical protein
MVTFLPHRLFFMLPSNHIQLWRGKDPRAFAAALPPAGKGERKMFSVQYISNVSLQDWDCFVIELYLHALHVVPSSSS